jgi:hypothetical protein
MSQAAVYYLGWLHVDSYLTRLGINHLSLSLPTTYYLKQGYLSVSAAMAFINLFAWYQRPAPKDRVEAAVTNTLVVFILVSVLLPYLVNASRQLFYFTLAINGLIIVIFVVLTLQKNQ